MTKLLKIDLNNKWVNFRAKNASLTFLVFNSASLLNYYEWPFLQLIEPKVNESIKRKNSKTNHSTLLDSESTYLSSLLILNRVDKEVFVYYFLLPKLYS